MPKELLADHVLADGPLMGWRIALFREEVMFHGSPCPSQRVELTKPNGPDIDEVEAERLNTLLKCYEFDEHKNRFSWRG